MPKRVDGDFTKGAFLFLQKTSRIESVPASRGTGTLQREKAEENAKQERRTVMKGITKRLLALLMALCMLSSLLVTAGATEDVAQESSGNTLTEEEANALLAGAALPWYRSLWTTIWTM